MKDHTKELAKGLYHGWRRYKDLFGVEPHGTQKQMAALLELTPAWKKITESLGRLEGLEK
jgi:hypothetical protein